MPCFSCEQYFAVLPCVQSELSLKDRIPHFNANPAHRVVSIYKRLMSNCPCQECIVKAKCSIKSYTCKVYFDHIKPDRLKKIDLVSKLEEQRAEGL